MPANGTRFSATATAALFPGSVSHAPVPPGRAGTEILSSTSAVVRSMEKMIPATAAARGVLSEPPLRSGPGSSASSVMASSLGRPGRDGLHGKPSPWSSGAPATCRVIYRQVAAGI
jgi:hypothetical protein